VIAADPLVRGGLVSLLGSELDFAVEGEPSGLGAEAEWVDLRLWDVGARLAEQSAESFQTPTLALVSDDEAGLDALRAGAQGVLLRSVSGERLIAALRALASGLGVFDPPLLRSVVATRPLPSETISLTPREAEVLGLIAEGLSNRLIADRLKISEHTVKFHVNAILAKLSAETRTEAVVLAARYGLLML
jgi:DNA-binding NarL/FixJ family response regulator